MMTVKESVFGDILTKMLRLFWGLKDILDHNLKETFYVNVVALTTWVGYDCCADIPNSEDIHESHYDCKQDIQSAKD